MSEFKRVVSHEQEYPGAYRWPICEILCPDCGLWVSKGYGEVDVLVDGVWRPICSECAKKKEYQ